MSDEAVLQVRIAGEDDSGGMFASAAGHMDGFASTIIEKAAEMTAAIISIDKAWEGLRAGIEKADELRDLALSLNVVTGSAQKGAEAMHFFEEAAVKTRSTADELGKTFRDLTPLASSRGFTQDLLEQTTVMTSQLGTIMGKSAADMETGLRQMLAGRVSPGRNPLLATLGFTKENVDVTWAEFFTRLQEKVKDFDRFGQSWESTLAKVKDSLKESFAAGFNEARDASATGMAELLGIVNSPDMKQGLGDLGRNIAEIAPGVFKTFEAVGGQIRMLFGGLETTVGLFLGGIGGSLEAYFNALNSAADAMPPWVKAVVKYGTGIDVASGREGADVFGALKNAGLDLAASGAEGVRAGMGMAADSMKPFATSTDTAKTAAGGFSDELKKLVGQLGKVGIGAKSAAEETLKAVSIIDMFAKQQAQARKILDFAGSTLTPQAAAPDYTGAQQQQFASSAVWYFQQAGSEYQRFISEAGKKWIADSKAAADNYAAEVATRLHDEFIGALANDFGNLVANGGKGFIKTMEHDFLALSQQGAKLFGEYLFGSKDVVDPATGAVLQKGQPGVFGEKGTKAAQMGLGMAEIGFGSYSAARSGQEGSVTAGVLGGAMSGAAMTPGPYMWVGAIVGAIVGGLAAEMGKMAARRDYQYAQASIFGDGSAMISNTKNISSGDAQKMLADTQTAFDTTWNSYVQIMMKANAGNLIPDISKGGGFSNYGNATGINQTSPYASFMSDFNLWLTQQLPREIAGRFQDGMKATAEKIGLNADQFDAIWKKFDKLDPKTAAADWLALFDILEQVTTATTAMGGKGPTGLNTSFFSMKSALLAQNSQSFAQQLTTSDVDLFTRLQTVMAETGDQQIKDAQSLAQMVTDRYNKEKAFVQQIIDLEAAAAQQAKSARDSITMMTLHKADGSPDYQAQAKFLQQQADAQLALIQHTSDPTKAAAAFQQYLQYVQQIVGLGYQQGTKTGDDYAKWAQKEIDRGQTVLNGVMDAIGKQVDNANQQFLDKFQPLWDGFKNSLGGLSTSTDDVKKGFVGLPEPIDRVRVRLNSLGDTLEALNARLATMTSSSNFAHRTAAVR